MLSKPQPVPPKPASCPQPFVRTQLNLLGVIPTHPLCLQGHLYTSVGDVQEEKRIQSSLGPHQCEYLQCSITPGPLPQATPPQNTLAPLAPMVKAHSKVGVVGATAYPATTDLQQWQQPWKAGGIRLLHLPSPAPNLQPLCPPLCFLGFPWYLESACLICFLRRPFLPLMLFSVVSPLSIPLPSSHIHFYCFTVFATKPESLLYQVTWHLHGPSGGHSSWLFTRHCPSAHSP